MDWESVWPHIVTFIAAVAATLIAGIKGFLPAWQSRQEDRWRVEIETTETENAFARMERETRIKTQAERDSYERRRQEWREDLSFDLQKASIETATQALELMKSAQLALDKRMDAVEKILDRQTDILSELRQFTRALAVRLGQNVDDIIPHIGEDPE